MIAFLLCIAALLGLFALLLLWRSNPTPRPADAGDANLRWFAQRRREIADTQGVNDDDLVDDAKLRLLEDGLSSTSISTPVEPDKALGRRFPIFSLIVVVSCVTGAIYLQTGAMEDVLIYRELAAITPEDSESRRQALLRRIEARSAERKDNLQYLSLLGQLYMAAEDFPAASASFSELAEKAPQDPQALAMAAQARFLASDRAFDDESQLLAERALAVDPTQRTALGLLGMASFEGGSYVAAINYWERLRDLEPTGSPGYQMLDEVIQVAKERGGLGDGEATANTDADNAEADLGLPGISVALSLPEDAIIDPAATVFVFARRAAANGGMPIAVRRLQAAQLPLTLRLVDADAMAGQLLSEAGEVLVSAQISLNGQPGASNAAFAGAAGPVVAGDGETSVAITLQRQG